MKKILSLLLILSFRVFADTAFDGANKLYESGKYAEAENAYLSLLKSGNKSAEVYYNLGNSYFKDKKLGLAILNYEKALEIAPRDVDIKYNLDFSGSFIKETVIKDTASKVLNTLYYYLTLNELCVILSVCFILLLGVLIYRIYRKDELSYWLRFSLSILFGILFIFSAVRIFENENTKAAIVITASVEAKAAPIENNPASFTIPEGKKVYILNTRRDWVEILLKSENMKGWIKKDTIAEI
ncbi:MAG: tetratricopeptide repeat protein [Candidatus Firestonebacteria bacterium]|nr:tetratricopeptide repeat protein [Candidatus Firestonebacteria bacterium]